MLKQSLADAVSLRFFALPDALRPYISAIYLTEITLPADAVVNDWLMPEWASIRMAKTTACKAGLVPDPLRPAPPMMVAGPTSYAMHVESGSAAIWGIGILPLGWARFVRTPASDFANRLVDGRAEPALAGLAPLHTMICGDTDDHAETAQQLIDHLLRLLATYVPADEEDRIVAAHRLLIDEDIGSVGELAERLELSPRTLERLSMRAFGFSPKLLLRRQRFTRSLAQFLLNPSLTWTNTLDQHYVDQPHFVRDFRRFMGMSPRAYAQADKPILRATAHARNAEVGGAVQALHRP